MIISAEIGKQYVPFLRSNLRKAYGILKPPLRELSLAIVNDHTMSRLHQQFMNLPGPTDVLTFPLEEDKNGNCVSGEVIVCLPEARRRAKELGHRIQHELLLYALHGMLHLAGFDDRTNRDFVKMHAMEDKILRQLGIGPVFAAPAKSKRNRGAR
jgi:probable rRNA maturation factor